LADGRRAMTGGLVPVDDTAEDSILVKTAKGAGWVIGWRLLTRALGLVSTLFLVRLLLPVDFGLVTLATSFSQAIDSLSSIGVEEAVIREKQPSRELYDSAFTINVIRGVATSIIIAAAAWPMARFFDDLRLFPVTLLLAVGSIVSAFENIGIVDFRRHITFHKEFVLMAVPRLVSIMVAISLAFLLHNYLALVIAILTRIVMQVAMGYIMHPYRPRFGLPAWRQIAGFSFWSWLLSLSGLLKDRSESFVIGRVFDITQVGVFSLGMEIAAIPTTELISPLSRAVFSGFAAARSSNASEADTGETFLRVVGLTTLIALPAGVGISLVADPIVKLAFGPNWAGATGVIQVLGVALTATIFGSVSGALMNAHALLKTALRAQVLATIVKILVLIALVIPFGLVGGAVAVGLATAFENLLYLAITTRFLKLRGSDLLAATWRSLIGVVVMTGGLVTLHLGWNIVPNNSTAALVIDMALAMSLGSGLYAATVALCWMAAGHPSGAERDVLALLTRIGSRTGRFVAKQFRSARSADQ
jgi:lipopolysaccharide exporter